jgi:hypothetical protein
MELDSHRKWVWVGVSLEDFMGVVSPSEWTCTNHSDHRELRLKTLGWSEEFVWKNLGNFIPTPDIRISWTMSHFGGGGGINYFCFYVFCLFSFIIYYFIIF